ncbi:MAG: methyltransferase domain-containing protein [Bryobacterales bacterium]|nr:methyltransferase domain-containing protein [Bryobacteraceae bacterium]MDW8354836.1 methyltransferase domain-containing protein [Bryobacterales bacterium]
MPGEFTGERVTPGQVEPDLWNEHWARYLFASRLAWGKRVLDAGCGTGYGAAELARSARLVVGVDRCAEAVDYARARYALPNLAFVVGAGEALPLPTGWADLAVAFEVIEHLDDWPRLLEELRRVLAPTGQALISTPNRRYYAEARAGAGPNPHHRHEFDYAEFREALAAVFPHLTIFLQNHGAAVVFSPTGPCAAVEARLEAAEPDPEQAHFFLAVCACAPQTGTPTFVYVPSRANLLRERQLHIARLESELDALRRKHLALQQELEEHNRWAQGLDRELEQARATIAGLQQELESKIAWALGLDRELAAKVQELAQCVEVLHRTERTLEERTNWAFDLQRQMRALEVELSRYQASRWVRLGRRLGLGPQARRS